jgi:hypothetical protein
MAAMSFAPRYIGIHSADAEHVSLAFQDQELHVSYVDWQEERKTVTLVEVFAFKWQERDPDSAPRDDTTFQVLNSTWLYEQTHGVPGTDSLVHYKVLFNACGVLDVICREVPGAAENTVVSAADQ